MMTSADRAIRINVQDLGRQPYTEMLERQRCLQREVIDARREDGPSVAHLLLLEHDPPVITVSRRPGARDHLVATPDMLAAHGVELAETDRGGDITYHGPGQLVVYPILDLNVFDLRLHGYMRLLEQIVIETIATWGLHGERDADATGVWLPGGAKICAMGVRVSRWVTMHGLALNVSTDLSHFDLIVPCGLVGRAVTSLHHELGDNAPDMDEVKARLIAVFTEAMDQRLRA